ncbi:MAG: zeta toxin family protein [Neisseriaceae bacterium]|nr:zeta toxin family protein [Neisseriaceae bacterium]
MNKKPEILFFAGPNGSGKSTISRMAKLVGFYINADDIKKVLNCSDLEAAQLAEKQREKCLLNHQDFSFETVLSTERNLNLLKRAKKQGYFIRGIYVLTENPQINLLRIKNRVQLGGHNVDREKVISRYQKSLNLIPEVVKICDILHIYDNSSEPFRIFKKRKNIYYLWENEFWHKDKIQTLTGIVI